MTVKSRLWTKWEPKFQQDHQNIVNKWNFSLFFLRVFSKRCPRTDHLPVKIQDSLFNLYRTTGNYLQLISEMPDPDTGPSLSFHLYANCQFPKTDWKALFLPLFLPLPLTFALIHFNSHLFFFCWPPLRCSHRGNEKTFSRPTQTGRNYAFSSLTGASLTSYSDDFCSKCYCSCKMLMIIINKRGDLRFHLIVIGSLCYLDQMQQKTSKEREKAAGPQNYYQNLKTLYDVSL